MCISIGGIIMQEMTKGYVFRTLREEHLWKSGEEDTFEVMLSQKWEFTLKREGEQHLPYKYSLTGKKNWNSRNAVKKIYKYEGGVFTYCKRFE